MAGKRKNDGYKPKKSKIFTREEMETFLQMEIFLLMKVVMIVGIAGACRSQELCDLNVDNVQDMGNVVIINISDSKNGTSRTFTTTADNDCSICHLAIFKK
ncbi:hypothetical protein NQ315_005068 [Exocentrus adspersus]|uniref:Tyr recombinase domain-containing protein n=1 Tax=Exocentrus adspersus TaxID=1586481 RepID=A0AAV8VR73_9CUCU|nr:hypothetical protein NQ315_005068 [Exocentrus adspersus]